MRWLVGVQNVMLGAEALRHQRRVGLLVEGLLRKVHGKRIDVSRAQFAHDGDDGGGIHAAAQEDAQGNVAHQARLRRLPQTHGEFLHQIALLAGRHRRLLRRTQIVLRAPVSVDVNVAAFHHHAMRRRKLLDLGINAARAGEVAVEEIVGERGGIHRAADPRVLKQRLDLRPEYQRLAVAPVIKGFLARAVARQKQSLGLVIPQGDGEHAVQFAQAVRALLLVQVDDGFAVGMRLEMVTAFQQPLAQLAVVIDLAVENQGDVAGFVGERLVAGFEINNAQPPDGQRDVGQLKFAAAVRPAMEDASRHRVDALSVRQRLKLQIENSANSTHRGSGNRLQRMGSRNPFPIRGTIRMNLHG